MRPITTHYYNGAQYVQTGIRCCIYNFASAPIRSVDEKHGAFSKLFRRGLMTIMSTRRRCFGTRRSRL